MKKKFLSILTTVSLLGTMACTGAVSSLAFTGEEIYFEVPEYWQENNEYLYVHFWDDIKGESPYEWHSKNQKMTWIAGEEIATYSIPDGDWNVLIISGNSGMQTANLVFNADCIGDTCYIPDEAELLTAPSDSSQTVYPIAWRNHTEYGMQKWITPLGNIVGTTLLAGQTNQDLYDRFVVLYEGEEKVEDWNTSKAEIVGKDWATVKKELAEELGLNTVEPATEKTTDISTDTPTDAPTNTPTDTPTAISTNAPTDTPTTILENNNSSSTVSGKVVNTSDRNIMAVLSTVLAVAFGVAFVSRRKKEN